MHRHAHICRQVSHDGAGPLEAQLVQYPCSICACIEYVQAWCIPRFPGAPTEFVLSHLAHSLLPFSGCRPPCSLTYHSDIACSPASRLLRIQGQARRLTNLFFCAASARGGAGVSHDALMCCAGYVLGEQSCRCLSRHVHANSHVSCDRCWRRSRTGLLTMRSCAARGTCWASTGGWSRRCPPMCSLPSCRSASSP